MGNTEIRKCGTAGRSAPRRPLLAAALLGAVLCGAWGFGAWGFGATALAQNPGGGPPAAPVEVASVRQVRQAPMAEYTGLIEPTDKAQATSDVAGKVVRLLKKAGDRVTRGEILARLDNPTLRQDLAVLQARVMESTAELTRVQMQHQRVESLFNKKLTSAQQYEDSAAALGVTQARVQRGQAEVERIKDQLERMVLRSPLSGQIIAANVELGQWITPNTVLFEIFNFERFEVRVGIPGRMIGKVPETGRAFVRIPELGYSLQGRILGVVRHVDATTGNFQVRVGVDNKDNRPLSGMVARVDLPVGDPGLLMTVPRDAVVRTGGRTHVVVVTDGKAGIVPVEVQGNLGSDVIVDAKGLADGQQVVVRGNERLFPGTPVRVLEGDKASAVPGNGRKP